MFDMKATVILLALVLVFVNESQALPCQGTYKKIGCYKTGNYLRNLLITDRDQKNPKSDGHVIDWDKLQQSIDSLACRCSIAARKLKYKYFGIRFYAECWAGNNIPLDGSQKTNTCFQGQNLTTCEDSSASGCAGKASENYIYEPLAAKVNGGFSNWTLWTACSTGCGTGKQNRSRTCDNPAPKNGGLPCVGPNVETKLCQLNACPVNGGFSNWTAWGKCSAGCGPGKQIRSRKCDSPAPKNGGLACVGPNVESKSCKLKPCPAQKTFFKRVCEDRVLHLHCPFGKRIQISSAMYGRTSKRYCFINHVHPHQIANVHCTARRSNAAMRARCHKRHACNVRAQNGVFGEPCRSTSKYLEVKYHCV